MSELVLITGMSGSGKSVALKVLEDVGYYCIDNLPPNLLLPFLQAPPQEGAERMGIAVDVRSASTLHTIPKLLTQIRTMGYVVKLLFLDTSTETLIKRFSETRRKHPLSAQASAPADAMLDLSQAIEQERELLGPLRDEGLIIDTTYLRNNGLQNRVKSLIEVTSSNMTLVFESFAFKRGIPVHADYVFDVRMLPNPYYELSLRPLTGLDEPVAQWLDAQPEVAQMQQDIQVFLDRWLPALDSNNRSYVTIAIGCTGGQHRSVRLAHLLQAHYAQAWTTLLRHRELS